jgi:general secretion pathway protein M
MKLARRERYFLMGAAVLVGAFCLFQFLVGPFFESRRRLARGVRAKRSGLEEIARLSSEYQRYRKGSQGIQEALARRRGGFTLFSFLEQEARDAGVKNSIKSMKPSVSSGAGRYKESLVEMRLEAISLDQLTGYLYRIESPDNVVFIKRITIKENRKKQGSLDAILQVLTYQ